MKLTNTLPAEQKVEVVSPGSGRSRTVMFLVAALVGMPFGLFLVTANASEYDPSDEAPPPAEVQELIAKLTNQSSRVRKEAAETLGRMGSKARAAVPALKRRVADHQGELKNALAASFINFMDDSRPAALKALRDIAPEEVPVALAGRAAILSHGTGHEEACPGPGSGKLQPGSRVGRAGTQQGER